MNPSKLGKIIPSEDIICTHTPKTELAYLFVKEYLDIKFPVEEYLTNPEIWEITAKRGNTIIGVRMFRVFEDLIHCIYTAVIPEERGKSINHQMLLQIEKIALDKGINKITSTARISNFASNRSLVKSGFILDESKETTYPCGEKKLHYYKFL